MLLIFTVPLEVALQLHKMEEDAVFTIANISTSFCINGSACFMKHTSKSECLSFYIYNILFYC